MSGPHPQRPDELGPPPPPQPPHDDEKQEKNRSWGTTEGSQTEASSGKTEQHESVDAPMTDIEISPTPQAPPTPPLPAPGRPQEPVDAPMTEIDSPPTSQAIPTPPLPALRQPCEEAAAQTQEVTPESLFPWKNPVADGSCLYDMVLAIAGIPRSAGALSLLAEASITDFYDSMEEEQRQALGTDIGEEEHRHAREALRRARVPGWNTMDKATTQKHDRILGAIKGDLSASRRYANYAEASKLLETLGLQTQFHDEKKTDL